MCQQGYTAMLHSKVHQRYWLQEIFSAPGKYLSVLIAHNRAVRKPQHIAIVLSTLNKLQQNLLLVSCCNYFLKLLQI